jgi:hypothetical protein
VGGCPPCRREAPEGGAAGEIFSVGRETFPAVAPERPVIGEIFLVISPRSFDVEENFFVISP